MRGLQGPARVVVSSTGDVFVTDYKKGRVTVFNEDGVMITTLDGLQAPLGLAISEVTPPAEQLPRNCPEDAQALEVLENKYVDKVTKFEALVSQHQALVAEFQAKLQDAQAAGDRRKERRYQRRVRQHTARVARFENRLQEFEDLQVTYNACNALWYDNKIPLPLIYVGDEGDGSVKILDRWKVTTLGNGSGEFIKPNGIAVSTDHVYVVDSKAHQVKVYDNLDGAWQWTFGSQGEADGQFDFPMDIAINEPLDEVYVSDFNNGRIVVFDLAGNWLRNILAPENDEGDPAFFRPSGLGIDPDGNLYVVDHMLFCVVIIDNWGTLVDMIGYSHDSNGKGQYWTGELNKPLDAAADGQKVYVTSNTNNGKAVKIFEVLP
jgi:DNA-binding beta-propeller fold protein YncE